MSGEACGVPGGGGGLDFRERHTVCKFVGPYPGGAVHTYITKYPRAQWLLIFDHRIDICLYSPCFGLCPVLIL